VRSAVRDPALPSRILERLQQFHNGVPIWGAEVVRDSDRGVVVAMFGELSPDLTLSTRRPSRWMMRPPVSVATLVTGPRCCALRN
jgi:hypothetical protein